MKAMLPIHQTHVTARLARVGLLIITTALLAGCGSRLSGTYSTVPAGEGLYKQIKFISGSKAELTIFVTDQTIEGPYVVEGDKVKITAGGQTQVFTIDKNGWLNGGEMIGKLCKK